VSARGSTNGRGGYELPTGERRGGGKARESLQAIPKEKVGNLQEGVLTWLQVSVKMKDKPEKEKGAYLLGAVRNEKGGFAGGGGGIQLVWRRWVCNSSGEGRESQSGGGGGGGVQQETRWGADRDLKT